MKIYHGTSAIHTKSILDEGIIPRGSRAGNWKHTVDSHADHVYLTTAYAGYFASSCAKENEKWLILEIDTDKLFQRLFYPDEDFLEQAERYLKSVSDIRIPDKYKTLKARTVWCRRNILKFNGLWWVHSVKIIGNCSYRGFIPPYAISAAVEYDPTSNQFVSFACADPLITIDNYTIVGGKYKALTRWFFEDDVDPKDICLAADFDVEMFKAQSEFLKERKGLVRLK